MKSSSEAASRAKEVAHESGGGPARVLHVTGRMDRAGAETMIMNLYRAMDPTRVNFDFLYFTDDTCHYDSEIESKGGRIFRLSTNHRPHLLQRLLKTYLFLRSHHEFVAIHSHVGHTTGYVLMIAKLAGVRVRVDHAHSASTAAAQAPWRRYFTKTSRWLSSRSATRSLACSREAGLYHFKDSVAFEFFPNALDLDDWVAQSRTATLDWAQLFPHAPPGTKLLQVGRIDVAKNLQTTLHILRSLIAGGDHASLLIVGAGPQQDEIEAMIDALEIRDFVKLLGIRSDVAQLMASASCLLLPSHFEGFPVVLVEAQALGLPALVSNRVSSEVDLQIGLVQFLPIEDVQSWVAAIQRLESNPHQHETGGLETIRSQGFDTLTASRMLADIYLDA